MSDLLSTARPWIGVERRHLATFVAVGRTGSFRGAARALGYSPPAVSQNLSDLERLIGAPLAIRPTGNGAVQLTAVGSALLGRAERILDRFAAARADLRAAAAGRAVRVGVAPALAAQVLPAVLPALARAEDVELREAAGDGVALLAQVESGALEVVIGGAPVRRDAIEVRRLASVPYVLAVPAGWSVVRGERVPAEILERLPLVEVAGDDAARVDLELRVAGIVPSYAATAIDEPAALALVAGGVAAALLPAVAIPAWERRVRTASLDGLVAPYAVCASWHRDRVLPAAVDTAIAAFAAALEPAPLMQRMTA